MDTIVKRSKQNKYNSSYGGYGSYGSLDKQIVPVSSFPFEIFDKKLRGIIKRFGVVLNVEPEVAGTLMLAFISGAVGNTLQVSPKDGFEVPVFIWFIPIAPSGYGKSPIMNTLAGYIKELQSYAYKDFQEKLSKYSLRIKSSKENIELSEKPKLEHYFVSDTTVEALAIVFEDTPRGVVIHQDELTGLINGLNQYKNGRGNDRQHYLELFDCQSWKIDRKTGTKFIPNTGASIVGSIQPKVMPRVFSQESFDDGFLPRFILLNLEDKPLKFSRKGIDKNGLDYWKRLLDYCYRIPLNLNDNGFVEPQILTLSRGGLKQWEAFHNEYGETMVFLPDRTKVFIPKLLIYSLKFAGILHVIKSFNNREDTLQPVINKEIIINAIKLTRFFAGQAIKVLGLYQPSEPKFDEFQQRLIKSLHTLQGEIRNGKLVLSKIVEVFNGELPDRLKHTPERVSFLLKDLGLNTKKSSRNLSVLKWEEDKIQELFQKITVPTVTTVTQDKVETEGE